MKQPKKLTRKLKESVAVYGLNANNWILLKDGDNHMTIIDKKNGKKKIIDKFARAKKGAGYERKIHRS